MSLTEEEICCLRIKADSCIAKIGYDIALKEDSGYCVDSLYEKLKYANSIRRAIQDRIEKGIVTTKNNIINFCNKKVFMSAKNSLFLTNTDSKICREELELTEECCISLCDLESKLNEICSHC